MQSHLGDYVWGEYQWTSWKLWLELLLPSRCSDPKGLQQETRWVSHVGACPPPKKKHICSSYWAMWSQSYTLLKFNIAAENRPGPKRKLISQPSFFRGYVKLRGSMPKANETLWSKTSYKQIFKNLGCQRFQRAVARFQTPPFLGKKLHTAWLFWLELIITLPSLQLT